MSQIRSIYLIANPDMPHSPAFERVRSLALAAGARVHIAAFCYSRPVAAIGTVNRDAMEKAREGVLAPARRAVEQQAVYLRDLGLEVSHGASWAHPALPEALAQIAEQQPDLVVMDTQDRSLPQRLFSVSLDQQLLRHAQVPVMLVGHADPAMPRRVLAAVDVMGGNEAARLRLMREANGIALQCGAELHLAYVSEPVTVVGSDMLVGGVASQIYAEDIERLRKQAFREFVAGQHIPADLAHFLEGPVGPVLCDFMAAKRFDLVVVVGSGLGRVDRWLLGSATEHLAQHSPSGLLALPPEQEG